MGILIHKGVQYGTQPDLSGKVDKVAGKGLSTEDYTTAEKEKLAGIAEGAQVNSITGVKGNAESAYRTGDVNLTAANIGLGNVDNTSDADKPISTAMHTELVKKLYYNAALFTTNNHAPEIMKSLYISKIDNAFYALDKRYDVTVINDGASFNEVGSLFDGNYESDGLKIQDGKTAVVTMDFSSAPGSKFSGYPYGEIYVSFYHTNTPTSVAGRAYNNYASHGVGWKDLTFTAISPNIYRAVLSYYGLQTLEITIVGKSEGTADGYTILSQIEFHPTRPQSDYNPLVDKFSAQRLYYDLTAPNFIGNLRGDVTGTASGNKTLAVNCGTLSSLPTTINNTAITADMAVVSANVGNPSAQAANDWQAVCVDGAVTISGTISGTTALTLYLMKSRT